MENTNNSQPTNAIIEKPETAKLREEIEQLKTQHTSEKAQLEQTISELRIGRVVAEATANAQKSAPTTSGQEDIRIQKAIQAAGGLARFNAAFTPEMKFAALGITPEASAKRS